MVKVSNEGFNKKLNQSIIRTNIMSNLFLKDKLLICSPEKMNPILDWETKCKNYRKLIENGFLRDDGYLIDGNTGEKLWKHEIKTTYKKSFIGFSKIDEFNEIPENRVFLLACVDEKEVKEEKQVKRVVFCLKKNLIVERKLTQQEMEYMESSRPTYKINFKNGMIVYDDKKMWKLIGKKDFMNNNLYPIRDNVYRFKKKYIEARKNG